MYILLDLNKLLVTRYPYSFVNILKQTTHSLVTFVEITYVANS
jgi:hypothetical protein